MAMTCEENEKVSQILEAIRLHLDSADVKQRLNRCPALVITSWKDENDLDLVHHCILHNNIVALMIMLTRGHFKSPHEPATWPYLHLVACLGHRTFVSSVIQEVKYQNDLVLLDWGVFDRAIKPRINFHFRDLEPTEKERKLSPIDVAAVFAHIGCVRLLLDFWQVQKPTLHNRRAHNAGSLYLSLACQANSPKALQLLLSEHSDKKEALEYALRMSAPDCVDIVLKEVTPADVKRAFQGMNLFHVLYSYSSCLSSEQYEAMVQITSSLIRHNQDVSASLPLRTYPLYSLLSHSVSSLAFEKCGSPLLTCLQLLLQAGADPNMDEIFLENKLQDAEQNVAFGRKSYSSAVNCLLGNLPFLKLNAYENPSDAEVVDSYGYKAVELLLEHGADLSCTGKFHTVPYEIPAIEYHYGTALHLMLSTRLLSSISYSLLRLILHNGIDVDADGSWTMPNSAFTFHYALNILPFSIWSLQIPTSVVQIPHEKYTFTSMDLEIFVYIMKFMSQSCLALAYKEFVNGVQILRLIAKSLGRLQALEKFHLQESVLFGEIVSQFEKGIKEPWSLQRCCSHVVWGACRKCVGNVCGLPIPGPLRKVIMNFH